MSSWDIPAEFQMWVCSRVRKCRWAGKRTELHEVPQPDKGMRCYRGHCPNCGGSSFFVRDARKSVALKGAA